MEWTVDPPTATTDLVTYQPPDQSLGEVESSAISLQADHPSRRRADNLVTQSLTDRRPKLLFLSQGLPYPPDGGAKIRTYHIMRLLSGAFDITALCFYRYKPGLFHTDVGAALTALGEFGTIEAFPIPQEHSLVRLVWDQARSVARHRAYTVFAYESADFLRRLRAALSRQRFDLVHVDSLDLSGYFEELERLPIVCTHHDAQSVLLRRRAAAERGLLRQRFVALQGRLTEDEERLWCPRVALNLAVSAADEATLKSIAPTARFAVVPNGVDVDEFAPSDDVAPTGLVAVAGLRLFRELRRSRFLLRFRPAPFASGRSVGSRSAGR